MIFIIRLGNLSQLFFQIVGQGLVVLNVLVDVGVGTPFNEDGVRNFLRSQSLLPGSCNVVEKECLYCFYRLIAMNLEESLGQTINLSFAGLIREIIALFLRLNRHQASM